MDELKEHYYPSDAFILNFGKMTFEEYKQSFDDDNAKKLRNDYDSRMRPTNILIYWLIASLDEKSIRNASTQTKLDVRGNLI